MYRIVTRRTLVMLGRGISLQGLRLLLVLTAALALFRAAGAQ